MAHRRPVLVVGGVVAADTGALARALAGTADGPPVPAADVLVWDERDDQDRWSGRPHTFAVRDRPSARWLEGRGLLRAADRATTAALRAHLRHRRDAPVVLVGRAALGISPWLARHHGGRAWVPTLDDLDALHDGLEVAAAEDGGPHVIATTHPELRAVPSLGRDPRHRWVPGLDAHAGPAADPAPARSLLGYGPPDRDHGIDLVGRALAARSDALRHAGATLRWLAPEGSDVPADEQADLHLAGVADLVQVVAVADLDRALADEADEAAALVLATRPGAGLPAPAGSLAILRRGVPCVGFGAEPAAELGLHRPWTGVAFGDVVALGDALVQAVRTPRRRPGPLGLAGLVGLLEDR